MDHIQFFDSILDFHADCVRIGDVRGDRAGNWSGGQSWKQAIDSTLKGRLEIVPRAEALLDKVNASVELEQPTWNLDVTGAFPSVPDFLAGVPETMYRQQPVSSSRAPVRVFAGVCVSGALDAPELEARGVAILALCQRLCSLRPVELWLYADLGGRGFAQIPVVRVDTTPLDLATATYAMTHPSFLRQVCFNWSDSHGSTGTWAWGSSPRQTGYAERLREALKAQPEDVVLLGGHVDMAMIRQPVEWVNGQIAQYMEAAAA